MIFESGFLREEQPGWQAIFVKASAWQQHYSQELTRTKSVQADDFG